MISITILIYSVLVLNVRSQEASEAEPRFTTELATPAPTADWDFINQRNIQTDNSQLNRNNQFQPLLPPQYGPIVAQFQGLPFCARLQFENGTDTFPRYFPSYDVPLDAFSVNWTDNDNSYTQPASFMQLSQSNGIIPFPYFQPRVLDNNRYSLIDYDYNPAEQNENVRRNWTVPPPIIYPENVPRRENRMNPAPALIDNFPPPDSIQRRYSDIRSNERAIPVPQYPLPPVFLPPPGIRSNGDRNLYPQLNLLNRPYFDRESGSTEPSESATVKNAPQVQNPQPLEISSVESPIPAETIPRRFIPNRPFPPPRPIPAIPPYSAEPVPPRFIPSGPFPSNPFPFGMPIPPPQMVPPFSFPGGILPPPTPPPIIPNAPLRPTLNIPPNEPSPAQPQPIEPEVIADAPLPPPIEGIPAEDAASNPSVVANSIKSPYEFGYEMNDGRGNDQHRNEFSDGSGTVTGSYGYKDAYGVYRLVNYIADKDGFRASIKSNEPGISNPGSADVRVEAEVPPPKAIEEGLRSIRLNAVEVPDAAPLPVTGEKK